MILKGVAIGALAIIENMDDLKKILEDKLLIKNIDNDGLQKIPDLSTTQLHYNKLIEQIIDLVTVVNSKYITAIYMTDTENKVIKSKIVQKLV